MKRKLETTCVSRSKTIEKIDKSGSLAIPIYQTATYQNISYEESTGFKYTRMHNPTRDALEDIVKELEGGIDAIAYTNGMAAMTTLFQLFQPGDHILANIDLYGGSIRFFNHIEEKQQVSVTYQNSCDLPLFESFITNKTKAIFIETPSNPLAEVTDLRSISKIAKKHGCILIVDNTLLTPYYQNPLQLGADIVLHSGTKFLAGHNDTLAGIIVTNNESLAEELRFHTATLGTTLAPFDCAMVIRGIKTLAIRMKQSQENAIQIMEFLKQHPKVKKVYYIGDPDLEGFELNKSQARGFGSIIGFELESHTTAVKVLNTVQVISNAASLGGVESLIGLPFTGTHSDIDDDEMLQRGINDAFLRLSVGIEHIDDLIADLEQALQDDPR